MKSWWRACPELRAEPADRPGDSRPTVAHLIERLDLGCLDEIRDAGRDPVLVEQSVPARCPVRADSAGANWRCCAWPRWGLTTREIADQLFISPKTAGHDIQHLYT